MALPITIPYTFGNAATTQSLSSLDSDFSTVYNAVNGIGNGTVTLANVSISGGNVSSANVVSTGSTTARTLAKRFSDVINVKDFGAYGDALHDDTAAIQAAINYAATIVAAGNGGRGINIWLPAGEYLVSSTLTVASGLIGIIGDGPYRTQIVRNGAFAHTILFQIGTEPSGSDINYCAVKGIGFFHDPGTHGTGNAMTGAHVKAVSPVNFLIDDCIMQNGAYGILIRGGIYVYINNVRVAGSYVSGVTGYNSFVGLYFQATTNSSVQAIVPTIFNITNCQVNASGSQQPFYPNPIGYYFGTVINAAEEMHFTNCTFNAGVLDEVYLQLLAGATASQSILEVTFNSCFFDTYDETYAVYIDASAPTTSGAIISRIRFEECGFNGESRTISVPPGNGLYVKGLNSASTPAMSVVDLSIVGCTFMAFFRDAIVIDSGNLISISSNNIYDNNVNDLATANAITIGSNVTKFKINDNIIGGSVGTTSKQRYGVSIAAGSGGTYSTSDFTIENNDVTNNTTGGILDNTTTTNKRITNNLGFNGNRAATSPTLPATTVNYTNPYGSPAVVSIFGGTVSDIKLNGTTITSATNIILNVGANDVLRLTYSPAPSWIWWPQ